MMHRTSRSALDQRGFSLTELLVSLLIIFTLSGLATYAFVSVSEQYRVRAAVQSIDSVMKRARQSAISARSTRRLVLEMYRDPATDPTVSAENVPVRMWIERKRNQFLEWPNVPVDVDTDRLELVSDVSQLPDYMRVADVTGVDAADLLPLVAPAMAGRVLLYFEFGNSGSVRVYFNSVDGREQEFGQTIATINPAAGTRSIYLHIVRGREQVEGYGTVDGDRTVFYYPPSGLVFYYNDATRSLNMPAVFDIGGGVYLNQVTGNEAAVSPYEVERVRVIRQIRSQVGTVHVIPQTGRTRAYDYGIGYPFSIIEMRGV